MLVRLNNKYVDQIIKNTYRTLMTRGMKGCYVYCANKELADYLRERIK
ncbi:DNA/RNA helicase domain-containing protein [Catenibacterium mitsuokai]